MSKVEWLECSQGGRWASECGLSEIARYEDGFGAGSYYALRWLGCYGQTCRREYGTIGDAKRAAAIRFRGIEIPA